MGFYDCAQRVIASSGYSCGGWRREGRRGGGDRTRGVYAEDDAGDAGVVGEVTQLPDERLGGDLAGLRLAAAGDVALRTHDRNDPLAGQAERRRRHCTAAAGVTAMLVARDARRRLAAAAVRWSRHASPAARSHNRFPVYTQTEAGYVLTCTGLGAACSTERSTAGVGMS